MAKKRSVDPLPEEFGSYEEAAEFWDSHDTTDYPDAFRTMNVTTEFRSRHYEVELEPDVASELRSRARRRGVKPGHLASDILRRQLRSAHR
jgi:predicted phosphatase